MRPDGYSRWIDPTPLEVKRPRLPWWTLLPRKLLLTRSPTILVVTIAALRRHLATLDGRLIEEAVSGSEGTAPEAC